MRLDRQRDHAGEPRHTGLPKGVYRPLRIGGFQGQGPGRCPLTGLCDGELEASSATTY